MKTPKALRPMIRAAAQMSNILYNLSQDETLPPRVRLEMKDCYRKWDEALTQYKHRKPKAC